MNLSEPNLPLQGEVKHPIIFLIGLHGSGKSTLGRHLARHHKWQHLSIGDIARAVRSGQRPDEISLRLVTELSIHRPGHQLSPRLTESIVFEVQKHSLHKPTICDGFPAHVDHLELLPKGCTVVHLTCSNSVRIARLANRAAKTARKWTAGGESERDAYLPSLSEALLSAASRRGFVAREIENQTNGIDFLNATALCLVESVSLAF